MKSARRERPAGPFGQIEALVVEEKRIRAGARRKAPFDQARHDDVIEGEPARFHDSQNGDAVAAKASGLVRSRGEAREEDLEGDFARHLAASLRKRSEGFQGRRGGLRHVAFSE